MKAALTIALLLFYSSPALAKEYEKYVIEKKNTIIDCNGGRFNDGKRSQIIIQSSTKLTDIVIRNCIIFGNIRIIGLGINGEAEGVKASSHSLGHTKRAQDAAPSRVLIQNNKIEESGDIPIYLSPGVTETVIEKNEFIGRSNSTALYLDAESAKNRIVNNVFNINTSREVIAVDGSANNVIAKNRFEKVSSGGIYLYRNCGEGGTVRHQSPQYNQIVNNYFNLTRLSSNHYGVWLGSRNGNRNYCNLDNKFKFGSGLNDKDYASHNTVKRNTFRGNYCRAIRVDSAYNYAKSSINNFIDWMLKCLF